MSSTYSLEEELKRIGEKLIAEGCQLQEAAELLRRIREVTSHRTEIDELRKRVRKEFKV